MYGSFFVSGVGYFLAVGMDNALDWSYHMLVSKCSLLL